MSSLKAVKDAIFPHISVMGSDPFCDPAFLRYKCATRILRPNSLCDVYHWFIGILRNAEGRPQTDHFRPHASHKKGFGNEILLSFTCTTVSLLRNKFLLF